MSDDSSVYWDIDVTWRFNISDNTESYKGSTQIYKGHDVVEGDAHPRNDGREEEKFYFHIIAMFFISQILLMLDNSGHQYICIEITENNIYVVNI